VDGPSRRARTGLAILALEVVEMTERTVELTGDVADNTVALRGRVSSAPHERQLPSGVVISTFRLSVPRSRTAMTSGSTQGSDWVDCTAWTARSRRTVASWEVGDRVELTGALRRRFYRAGEGAATRLEVEVLSARRVRPREDR
jgi:single-strand DNA-binding protein